jgi:hypothetical protein
MQKMILTLAALLLLAGCGRQSSGSLGHALAALRDGDYEDFLAAKAQSDEEIKSAVHADGDLCLITQTDITKYRMQYGVSQIDHKELFALPEEERLAYALKVGVHLQLAPGSFLEHTPLSSGDFAPPCQDKREKAWAAWQADGGHYSDAADEERLNLLKDWRATVQDKHGAGMDEKMHAAVSHLDAIGYSAKWPSDPIEVD